MNARTRRGPILHIWLDASVNRAEAVIKCQVLIMLLEASVLGALPASTGAAYLLVYVLLCLCCFVQNSFHNISSTSVKLLIITHELVTPVSFSLCLYLHNQVLEMWRLYLKLQHANCGNQAGTGIRPETKRDSLHTHPSVSLLPSAPPYPTTYIPAVFAVSASAGSC